MAQLGGPLSEAMETLSQVMSLVETFRLFDADNDGLITSAELGGIMASLGCNPSDQEVNAMMQRGDTNRDGLLSLEEFLEMNTKELELGGLGDCLKLAFDSLDVEGDEGVTGGELYDIMGDIGVGLSLESCKDIIASMDGDGDGDGAISFEDFKLIVNSLL